MTDYIDREAFLASKVFLVAGTLDDYDQGYMDGVDAVEGAAKEFPAADVRPVVHGKWDYILPDNVHGVAFPHCSICEEQSDYMTPFCPHCGAHMDGGDAE